MLSSNCSSKKDLNKSLERARKDETLKAQKREIDNLYNRVKKYLLMQDHLYKNYVDMEEENSKTI